NCPLSLLISNLLFLIAREDPNMNFLLPEEATITTIESVAIPAACKKQDLVYEFINYIYSDAAQASQVKVSPLFPACEGAMKYTSEVPAFYQVYEDALKRKNFYFFRYLIPEEEIRDIWVEVKN